MPEPIESIDRIDQIDRTLTAWVENVLGVPTVSLQPPRDDQSGEGITLYLMELTSAPPPRSSKRPPLQFSLRYLVTAWGEEAEAAHRLLGELACAAMERPGFEVEFEPLPAATWAAFGIPPQPSFMLRVPFRRERPEAPAPLVRAPVVVQASPLVHLKGVVLGPGEVPLMGARIELPAQGLSTRTGADGAFSFATVAAEFEGQEVRVRAKGREISLTIEQPASSEEPLVIHFDPFE